ncbi:hypothetical protein N787_13740 [Arenimonas metalli CF5-1]|uniref:Major facilitator superfamily (MFS) profile domain-containing protein n=2 Tax=Arenimonas TaxID=490567 RepID=A0A091BIT9_9GAMM|nr:hypothetical protein N787_13740 [Arenimonas metalli CF5-1]
MYSLFGTTGGLLSYYSYDFARDDRQLLAFALVGGAMFVLCFTIAFQSRGLLLATPRR